MDEIDAALDFRNVSIVANYIKDRTKNAQFIIISLRYEPYFIPCFAGGLIIFFDRLALITPPPPPLIHHFRPYHGRRNNVIPLFLRTDV